MVARRKRYGAQGVVGGLQLVAGLRAAGQGDGAPCEIEAAGPDQVVGTHKTVNGADVTVSGMGDHLMVNNANVVCGGIATTNATVYLIDTVLLPPAS